MLALQKGGNAETRVRACVLTCSLATTTGEGGLAHTLCYISLQSLDLRIVTSPQYHGVPANSRYPSQRPCIAPARSLCILISSISRSCLTRASLSTWSLIISICSRVSLEIVWEKERKDLLVKGAIGVMPGLVGGDEEGEGEEEDAGEEEEEEGEGEGEGEVEKIAPELDASRKVTAEDRCGDVTGTVLEKAIAYSDDVKGPCACPS